MTLPAISVRYDSQHEAAVAGAKQVGAAVQGVQRQTTSAAGATGGFSGALGRLGTVSGSTRSKIQQVSFQIQDIAVQLQGGTRASVALAQQLPQLAGAFGAVGAAIGVGVALGIPALSLAMQNLTDDTGKLEQALEDAAAVVADTTEKLNFMLSGLRSLEEYRLSQEVADMTRGILEMQETMAQIEEDRASGYQRRLRAMTGELEMMIESRDAAQEQLAALQGAQVALAEMEASSGNVAVNLRNGAMALEAFGGPGRFIPEDAPPWDPLDAFGGPGDPVPEFGPWEDDAPKARGRRTAVKVLEEELTEREQMMKDHMDQMRALTEGGLMDQGDAWAGFFGDLNTLANSSSKELLAISKATGAAMALINAWQAHNEVLAAPGLPWYLRAASALKILATGMGAVDAIKGVSAGGGRRGGASAAGAAAAQAGPQYNIAIDQNIQGDFFTADQLAASNRGLLDSLVKEVQRRGGNMSAVFT